MAIDEPSTAAPPAAQQSITEPPPEATAHRALAPVVGKAGVDGIPAIYDDGRKWLQHGLRRQPKAALLGLFVAWSAIQLAMWGAAVGAVVGVLLAVGVISGHFGSGLFAADVSQAVSPVTIALGLVVGAVGGFLLVLKWIIFSSPLGWLAGLFVGAVVALILVIVIAAYERLWLRLRGYRRLTRDEVRRIAPLVKDIAEGMDLDGLPRFAMLDNVMPGAWAHMRTVVLTTGLLQTLDDAEVRAILAHELHHWHSGDSVGSRLVWACSWPLALTLNIGLYFMTMGRRDFRSRYGSLITFAGWLVAWPAWVITKYAIVPMSSRTMRQYEYAADAAAAQLGGAPALISALTKLSAYDSSRTGWEEAMKATHPPTPLRIEALQQPKPDDAVYQEDELRGPSRGELKRLLTPFIPRRTHAQQSTVH